MRLKFAQRLHELAGDRQSLDIAKACGVNPSTVAGWLSGRKMPDMELWPKLGKTLGLKDYREMLPPV